jgi:lipopolysaccharide transport system ATP-binding protein
MSSEISISANALSKCFLTYDRPQDRLYQGFCYLAARLLKGKARDSMLARAHAHAREFWAVKNISFEVRRGETVGIIGRNGSGKSTLLQMIAGTLAPTAGESAIKGRVAALLELGAGFNPEYTGRDNVYINGQVLGLSREDIAQRMDDIIKFADIGDFIDQPVKNYSSGMFVRLAFAVIAHVDADILIIDEALSVGDAFFSQKCMRYLKKFMTTGTVLFVSHDTASVKSLCSRVIWLEHGELMQSGDPKKVCDAYLQAFYEEQQGVGSTTRMRVQQTTTAPDKETVDQRLAYVNQTSLRNDLQVFDFDPNADSFGLRGAQIKRVLLLDSDGNKLNWIVGGEEVALEVTATILEDLSSPIIGFELRDRNGQVLFGDNTYITYLDTPLSCQTGEELVATFRFRMPIMPKGEYSISVAIASGSQIDHKQHHWIFDALMFRSDSTSVARGLVGIPMSSVRLSIQHADAMDRLDPVANSLSGASNDEF